MRAVQRNLSARFFMKILVACEYSGIVRDAFSRKGHDVISCDLLPTESPGRHFTGDVFQLLSLEKFDLIIGFPPCTYLSKAQQWMYKHSEDRKQKRDQALQFFIRLFNAGSHVALENPPGYLSRAFRPPDQIIQPWHFGDSHRKEICLWLKNVPPLISTAYSTQRRPVNNHTNSRMPQSLRAKIRSRFFPAVASAMSEQWTEEYLFPASSFQRSL